MGRFTGMTIRYLDPPNGGTLAYFVAERHPARLLGLAGLRSLPAGVALLIPGCRSIHTFGMRFRLDVLFVGMGPLSLEILELHRAVARRRIVRASRAGVGALELAAGEAERLSLAPGLSLRYRAGDSRLEPERASHPLGQIPVPVSEQLHRRRHEHRPHDRRIEQDRRR
jgi:uncharacterized membrane protein (UPF0127 family)